MVWVDWLLTIFCWLAADRQALSTVCRDAIARTCPGVWTDATSRAPPTTPAWRTRSGGTCTRSGWTTRFRLVSWTLVENHAIACSCHWGQSNWVSVRIRPPGVKEVGENSFPSIAELGPRWWLDLAKCKQLFLRHGDAGVVSNWV